MNRTEQAVALWSRKVREAHERVYQATIKRDNAIRQMRAEGATLRACAAASGLSHTAIANITSGHTAEVDPEAEESA